MIPGVIYLDGPDACGKTTLARRICERFDGHYAHLTYIKDNRSMWRANYLTYWQASKWQSLGRLSVIDRGWISENIYSAIYRDGSAMGYDARGFDRVLRRLATLTVVCAPLPRSAVERHARCHADREELYAPSDKILHVAEKFWALWHGLDDLTIDEVDYTDCLVNRGGLKERSDCMLYDIDEHGSDLDGFIDEVMVRLGLLRAAQHPACFNHGRPNLLGHVRQADVLFVGDCINPRKNGRWPLVDYGASSRTMSQALHELGFDETRGMWTNANDPDEHVEELLERESLKVVALGGNAALYLDSIGVDYAPAFHPSYVRRFNKLQEFKNQLITPLSR